MAGNGDVLLAYENDSIAAVAAGDDVNYILPDDTLLIQNPVALTKDASTAAKDFLKFQLSSAGQTDYAKAGFRPVIKGINVEVPGANDPSNPFPAVKTQYTIDKTFGGWDEANTEVLRRDERHHHQDDRRPPRRQLTCQLPSLDWTPGRSGAAGRVSTRP